MCILNGIYHNLGNRWVSVTAVVDLHYLYHLVIPANVIFLQATIFVFANMASKLPATSQNQVTLKRTSMTLKMELLILQCTDASEVASASTLGRAYNLDKFTICNIKKKCKESLKCNGPLYSLPR